PPQPSRYGDAWAAPATGGTRASGGTCTAGGAEAVTSLPAGTDTACGGGTEASLSAATVGTGSIEAGDSALALYVHMPWCVRKCPYCDFNSHQLKSAQPDVSYIDALLRDFDMEAPRVAGRRIDTVFFGGGTPSLFSPEEFARLLRALRQRVEFANDAEITLEP